MQVTLEYAQEHFGEIATVAQDGEAVEITRAGLPSVFLISADMKEADPLKSSLPDDLSA